MCVFSYVRTTFLLLWPWPWPDDMDVQTWPRYSQDVHAYQNEVSRSSLLKVRARTEQTDTQTNATQRITTPYSRVLTIILSRWMQLFTWHHAHNDLAVIARLWLGPKALNSDEYSFRIESIASLFTREHIAVLVINFKLVSSLHGVWRLGG